MGKSYKFDPYDDDFSGRPSKADRKRMKAERRERRKRDEALDEQMRPVDIRDRNDRVLDGPTFKA